MASRTSSSVSLKFEMSMSVLMHLLLSWTVGLRKAARVMERNME